MEQLSKAKIKLFGSLLLKKCREEEGMFLAEGVKMAREAISSGAKVEALICASDAADQLKEEMTASLPDGCFAVSPADFARMSGHVSPEGVLAVVRLPDPGHCPTTLLGGPWLLLDGLQDPGNVGTLVRTADWFGFAGVICGPGTADAFNPKALRASMGSIFRVPVWHPVNWEELLTANQHLLWLADSGGTPVGELRLSSRPALLVGSESHGPSAFARSLLHAKPVSIPGWGKAESLNAAIAGSILAFAYRLP